MKSREDILKIARELSDTFATRAADHDAQGTFPHENFADFRAAGYPLLPVPAEYGGWGASLSDAVRAQEIIAQGDGSSALAITMHLHVIGSEAAAPGWRAGAFAALCGEVIQRGALVNSCATEPEMGSPSRGGLPKTTARHDGNAWVINGRKSFATLAPELDYYLITATVQADEPKLGSFLVPRQPAVCIEEAWDVMGMRSTGSHDLAINGARVSDDHLLALRPAPPAGQIKLPLNPWFALNVSAVYVGVAAAAHRYAMQYAKTRVPTALGRPIATLESIQRRLGEAELALQTARSLIYHAADIWDRCPEQRETMNEQLGMVKIVATNKAIEIVDHAMRVVGGTSMMQNQPLSRYYRDVRAGIFHPPAEDAALPLYGRLALEREGENVSELQVKSLHAHS